MLTLCQSRHPFLKYKLFGCTKKKFQPIKYIGSEAINSYCVVRVGESREGQPAWRLRQLSLQRLGSTTAIAPKISNAACVMSLQSIINVARLNNIYITVKLTLKLLDLFFSFFIQSCLTSDVQRFHLD